MGNKINIENANFKSPITGERIPLLEVINEADIFTKGSMSIIKSAGMKKLADKYEIKEIDLISLCEPSESNFQKHWVKISITDPYSKVVTIATGEADRLNTGKWEGDKYTEVGVIDAQYRGAMAEKRAFDRAMIKHLQIYNTYSEIEAGFNDPKPSPLKDVKKILENDSEPDVVLEAGSAVSSDIY